MKKKLEKLKYLEEQSVYNELRKIDNAEKYYKNRLFFNSLSAMLFVMSFIAIITGSIYQALFISVNDMLVMAFVCVLVLSAFISLLISTFYNFKTLNLVKDYYNS